VCCEVGAGRVETRKDLLGVCEQQLACVSQMNVSRSTKTLDQANADKALQLSHLLADSRLNVPKLLGRAPKRPFARNR